MAHVHDEVTAPQPVPVHDVVSRDEAQSVTWCREALLFGVDAAHLVLSVLALTYSVTPLVLLVARAVHARMVAQRLVTVICRQKCK